MSFLDGLSVGMGIAIGKLIIAIPFVLLAALFLIFIAMKLDE